MMCFSWWMVALGLYFLLMPVVGKVTLTEISNEPVYKIKCLSDGDITFSFINKSTPNAPMPIAGCEMNISSCYLMDQDKHGHLYTASFTQGGGLFSIKADDVRTRGNYTCCEMYDSSVCDRKDIGSLATTTTHADLDQASSTVKTSQATPSENQDRSKIEVHTHVHTHGNDTPWIVVLVIFLVIVIGGIGALCFWKKRRNRNEPAHNPRWSQENGHEREMHSSTHTEESARTSKQPTSSESTQPLMEDTKESVADDTSVPSPETPMLQKEADVTSGPIFQLHKLPKATVHNLAVMGAELETTLIDIERMPGVLWCFPNPEILRICIDQSSEIAVIEERINEKLKKCAFSNYEFVYGKLRMLCASGDSVTGGCGTLGGFVKKVTLPCFSVRDSAQLNKERESMVALVSRHVAHQLNFEFLTVDKTELGRIGLLKTTEEFDVLPVDVFEYCEHLCDTRFKTECNRSMHATLARYKDIEDLLGYHVHIWGATSRPGQGILVDHDISHRRILIRDRAMDEPFAQAGDSGAMVCYFDSRRDVLVAIAMVVGVLELAGEPESHKYVAEILDDSLQKLSIMNECTFELYQNDKPKE